jgi:chromosomal replication initiation ATPase DnaA
VSESDPNLWVQILSRLGHEVEPEEFRRWFSPTSYASDAGDLISVWVPTETVRRHLLTHYLPTIERAVVSLRPHTSIRFVVAGISEDEDEEDE